MSLNDLSSRAIIGRYYETLEGVQLASWVDPISMLFTSDQKSETYKWLGMSPAMREWIAGRQLKRPRVQGVTIENLHYEASLAIPIKDMRRDKTAQIFVRVDDLASRSIQHWNSLLSTLVLNGESTACYDGQFFFDTDHSEGDSGTHSNDLASTDYSELEVVLNTNPTADELADVIIKMVQHFYTFKDDQGEPMNEDAQEFLVMVPPPYLGAATKAVYGNSLNVGTGVRDNPVASLRGLAGGLRINLVVNPRLTWTTKLAMFRTDGRVKPLIRQQEQETEFDTMAEGSDAAFYNKEYHYGVDAWRNVGYGYWQHAMLATLATA